MKKLLSIALLTCMNVYCAEVKEHDLSQLLTSKEECVHLKSDELDYSKILIRLQKICGSATPKSCAKLRKIMKSGHEVVPFSVVMQSISEALEALEKKTVASEAQAQEKETIAKEISEYAAKIEADLLWVTQDEVDTAVTKKGDQVVIDLMDAEIPSATITRVPTNVVNGQSLGDLTFQGYHTTYQVAAEVKSAVDGTPGAAAMPGRLMFTTTDTDGTNNERMRITQQGRVGVNTISPNALMNIEGDASAGSESTVHIGLSATALTSFATAISQSLQVDGNLYVGNDLIIAGSFTPTGDITLVNNSATADSECLGFEKSRGTAVTPTVVQDGDYLGMICFKGYDGDQYIQGSAISSEVDGTPANDTIPTSISFRTSPTGVVDPFITEIPVRMQISPLGAVGIPTVVAGKRLAVDTNKLIVDAAASEVGIIGLNQAGKALAVQLTKLQVSNSANEVGIGAATVAGKSLAVESTKLQVSNSANEVGIGAATVTGKSLAVETTKLVVDGTANEVGIGGTNASGVTLNVAGANATTAAFSHTTPASTLVTIGDTTTPLASGTTQLAVQGDVFAAAYKTSSDIRIKTNVDEIDPEESLSLIQRLVPKTFDFTSESQEAFKIAPGRNRGLMAQEVQAVIPEVVSIAPNQVTLGGKTINDLHLLSYMGLIPDIIGAVKANDNHVKIHKDTLEKLFDRVEQLEARLTELEARNS